MNKTIIIAEAGVNHNGDLVLAKKLIEVAANAGADFVKFQTFNADRQVTKVAKKADYQKKTTNNKESQHLMLRRLELSEQMHYELISHCDKCNIKFFSTGFDIESINFLNTLNQQIFKIPSGEITNLPYLRHIGSLGKKVIMSTGMASIDEIESAINILEQAGMVRNDLTVLHCTTQYPTPMSDVNLRAMISIKKKFEVDIGYSDHTLGIEIASAAVAIGAKVIEKHFTLDRNLPGPDHLASLEPLELNEMVANIRNIETALGDGVKRAMPGESKNKNMARKSLVAATSIKAGEIFTTSNIDIKRPGNGISPMLYDEIIGQKAIRDFVTEELIEI
ncbi:N-acetylneuraminate synthase [Gammaproteobacteria bacterium]|nr:N-acetylneuraminate synthase [Gammaproteobacteria bacterium]